MSKRSIQIQETPNCGIDVSAKSLPIFLQETFPLLHLPLIARGAF
jgi:hypothetical protein